MSSRRPTQHSGQLTVGRVPTVVNIVASQFDVEHALAGAGLTPRLTDLTAPPLLQRRKETASGSPLADDELIRAADHVTESATDGGDTSIANAGLECSSHNRFEHRSRLRRMRLGTDRVVTTRADRSQIRQVGQRSRSERRAARAAAFSVHRDVSDALCGPLRDLIRVDLSDDAFRLAS